MRKETTIRRDIVETLSQEICLSIPHEIEVLENVLKTISENWIKEEQVTLSSFDTFEVLHKSTRIDRNPKTKEEVTIEPRKSISFRASKLLKDHTASK